MEIQISDHFTNKKLFRFVFPSIAMMIFTSIYGVVDGYFVSNFTGKTPFAAVNIIMPFIMLLGGVGFMIGTGGSALVAKVLGEGDRKRAQSLFSLMVYTTIALGLLLSVIGELSVEKIAVFLGADSSMLDYCVVYARISFISLSFFMLQNVFQSFFVVAQKPNLGLFVTVLAGVINMILDFVFVGLFKWGIDGAALATMTSEFIGGGIPLIYFSRKNTSLLRLTSAEFDVKALLKAFTNGSSEMLTNISMSIVNMVFNHQLIRLYGENGVAAYGVIMYANFVFSAVFFGYSIGVAPIIGYNYGAKNHKELQNVYKKSMAFNGSVGFGITIGAMLLSGTVAKIFVNYDASLMELTSFAFCLFSTRYCLSGFNIFSSSFFTALNNGGVSAIISFMRNLVFQLSAVILLPMAFGASSIWLSMTVCEIFSLAICVFFLVTQNKKYHYAK